MKNKMMFRIGALVAAVVVVAVAAVGGYAYWTSTGSGSGDATVGTDSNVTVSDVAFSGTVYPGGSVTVSAKLTNASSNTAVKVDDLKLAQAGISTDKQGCDAAWFTYTENNNSPQSIAASGNTTISNAGSLSMSNAAVNQDACKGAKVTVPLTLDNASL